MPTVGPNRICPLIDPRLVLRQNGTSDGPEYVGPEIELEVAV
jgi:hypothetical protein